VNTSATRKNSTLSIVSPYGLLITIGILTKIRYQNVGNWYRAVIRGMLKMEELRSTIDYFYVGSKKTHSAGHLFGRFDRLGSALHLQTFETTRRRASLTPFPI